MKPYCYLNGQILPVSEANVNVYDIGLLRGYGIYEAFMTYGGKPFMFADHLARFKRSAAELEISIPASDAEISAAIAELIAKNGFQETIIKFILTGGPVKNSVEYDPATPTFYILAEEFVPLPDEVFENGASLILHEHQRQLPHSKTIDYLQAVKLQKKRKEAGALEILFVSNGQVLEAATSNIFIVKDGKLVTPKDGVLHGITRKAAMLAAAPYFAIEERPVTMDEFLAADEAFLTSSFKEIVPIVSLEGRRIGEGRPGPVTKKVLELFRAFAHGQAAPTSVSAPALV